MLGIERATFGPYVVFWDFMYIFRGVWLFVRAKLLQ